MIAFAAGLAAAAVPAGLLPVVAPASAGDDWHAYLQKHEKPSSDLACAATWPGYASLCLRRYDPPEGATRTLRWVTTADLAGWKLTMDDVRVSFAAAARGRVEAAELRQVVDMPGKYIEIIDGEGWAAAGLLAPDALAARLGGPPIAVAVPAEQVLFAWKLGDDQVDLAMAVGVHDVFTHQSDPVSEVIHAWDGSSWSPWAVATPHVAPPSP